ncbi:MAG: hypothetical protein JW982_16895 [Spirochaetes bacterium]|nr:hypothetical protein [Spirochaetota bacterium]
MFRLASANKVPSLDVNSVKEVNAFGYRLYKLGKYSDAADVFRRAVQLDESYKFAHYNLACMLSLAKGEGVKINPRELIYHLQYAAFLDGKYLNKFTTDADLDSIRNDDYFIDFMNLISHGRLTLMNKKGYLDIENRSIFLMDLIEEYSGPLFIAPEFELSPDKKSAACIAFDGEKAYLYVVTSYGFGYRLDDVSFTDIHAIFYSRPVWHPESMGILFEYKSELSFFNMRTLKIESVIKVPVENRNGITFYEIGGYWFKSPTLIRFMGGGSLEYEFSGCEYEININGSGLRTVPGGKVTESSSWQ